MSCPYAEVIGDPISQSKSPQIHNFWLERLGIAAAYRSCHVRPADLAGYIAQRRADPAWRGCNVTLPHKVAVLDHADLLDGEASRVGAANTLRWRACNPSGTSDLIAANTDVDGIRHAITTAAAGKAVVIGAGGAARAAFAVLSPERGPIHVIARNHEKAVAVLADFPDLNAQLHDFGQAQAALEGADLVINATQLGMYGQPEMPETVLDSLDQAHRAATVFDMVYAPLETALLARARSNGRRAIDGLTMLIGQARVAFAHFFEAWPPEKYDAELRALLQG